MESSALERGTGFARAEPHLDAATGRERDTSNVVEVRPSRGSRQWTIKGIAPEDVEISREAARRSGMKLNSWVGSALRRAAIAHEENEHQRLEEEDVAARVAELESYVKAEFERLRAQTNQVSDTLNCLSALLLKMYRQQSFGPD
jgi:hypothetical protein